MLTVLAGASDEPITLNRLKREADESSRYTDRLGVQLTRLGYIEEKELTAFLSKQYGVPSIALEEFEIAQEIIRLVPFEVAARHSIIPVNRAGASLIVAMADPSNIFALDELKQLTGLNIEVVVASPDDVAKAIERYYNQESGPTRSTP